MGILKALFAPYEGPLYYAYCIKCGAKGANRKSPESAVRDLNDPSVCGVEGACGYGNHSPTVVRIQ